MAWREGPLPLDTWGWGGVVPIGENSGTGFYFADFCGDHVMIPDGKDGKGDLRVEPAQVARYDNSLTLPPGCKSRKEGA